MDSYRVTGFSGSYLVAETGCYDESCLWLS